MDKPESKRQGRPPGLSPDKIDLGSTAYLIVVMHVGEGDLMTACERIGRDYNTVYGWLRRGVVPARQQGNLIDRAAEAGRDFPFEWFVRGVPAQEADAA